MSTILIVDDEPQLLYSVQEFLTHAGYDTLTAENGVKGLDQLLQTSPDLIISDILMEDMDGHEFHRRVQALTGSTIPFIFLTAKSNLDERLVGLRNGADDYITKPFAPEELAARIDAVLHRVERTREKERDQLEALRTRTLSDMASKLREPVQELVVQLNSVSQERDNGNPEVQRQGLRRAIDNANTVSNLVDNLKWVSADAADATLSSEPVRIAPILRRSAASASRRALMRDVQLSISCGGLLTGIIDENAMIRTLSNLVEAAVELSPAGGNVSIMARRAPDRGLEFTIIEGDRRTSKEDESDRLVDALNLARHVIRGHHGKLAIQTLQDGRQSYVLWVPGRSPRTKRDR